MAWIDNSLTVACPACEAGLGERCLLICGTEALESHVERWSIAKSSCESVTTLLQMLHELGERDISAEN
jgi:hypothetical protein